LILPRGKQRFYCKDCRRFSRQNPTLRKSTEDKKSYQKYFTGKLPSKGALALELQGLFQELNRVPTTTDVTHFAKKGRCHHIHWFYAVFGDFKTAIKTAGLRPRYKQEFDKEQLLTELRTLHKKLKRPLIQKDVVKASKEGKCSYVFHFQRAFGSVPNAIREAGAGKKKPSKEDLIKELKETSSRTWQTAERERHKKSVP